MKRIWMLLIVSFLMGSPVRAEDAAQETDSVAGIELPQWAIQALDEEEKGQLEKILGQAQSITSKRIVQKNVSEALGEDTAEQREQLELLQRVLNIQDKSLLRLTAKMRAQNPQLQKAPDNPDQQSAQAEKRKQREHFLIQGGQEIERADTLERSAPPPEVGGMNNVSLSLSGTNVSFCLDQDDQCAFRDPGTGISISSLSPGSEPTRPERDVLTTYEAGETLCKALDWAGIQGWRLPSFRELRYLATKLGSLADAFSAFGRNDAYLWTNGFPNEDSLEDVLFDPAKAWILSPGTQGKRQLPKQLKAGLRCVKSDAEKLWLDASTVENSATYATCTAARRECSFEMIRPKVRVTAPLTYRIKNAKAEGIHYATAKSYCSGLRWNGITGWRLPKYEEGYDMGKALFKGYALSRDALVELPEGRFWVEPPKFGDDKDAPVPPYQTVLFTGYACNFGADKCERIREVANSNRYPGQAEPDLPRSKLLCAHD